MSQSAHGSLSNSSLVSSEKTELFNIKNEKDTLALLHTIHRSAISQDIKNQLRDLLFSYRQSKTEDSFKNLKEIFLQHGFSVSISSDVDPEQNTSSRVSAKTPLGHSRLTPQFAVSKQKEVKVQVKKTTPLMSPQKPDQESQTSTSSQPEDEKKEPVKTDVVVSNEDINEEKVNSTLPQKQSQENKTTVKNHQAETVVSKETENPIVRIKEIKKLVNQKVGNPVSLIGLNEEVGREYMSALLDAMKLANGGQSSELHGAMDRLENVFAQVESLDLAKSEGQKVSEETEDKKEVVIPTKSNIHPVEEDVTHYPIVEEKEVTQEKVAVREEKPQIDTKISTAPTSVTPPASVQKPEASTVKALDEEEGSVPDTKISSVAKEKQLQELMRNNRSQEVRDFKKQKAEKIASMDPLMVPSITAGLNQLLSEWSLFKSSGFFGTGPSGADHVLYKKLQGLTMAAVIAGRFEGATPQIKQSITDYMNGWRYEEGIVHEHAETFEHYLRRVIKHILDKNKTSPSN